MEIAGFVYPRRRRPQRVLYPAGGPGGAASGARRAHRTTRFSRRNSRFSLAPLLAQGLQRHCGFLRSHSGQERCSLIKVHETLAMTVPCALCRTIALASLLVTVPVEA